MMASPEKGDLNVFAEEDGDDQSEDEDDGEEDSFKPSQKRKTIDDLDSLSPSTTSSSLGQNAENPILNPNSSSNVFASVLDPAPLSSQLVVSPPVYDSRRLFHRLWTDDDEIELLRGFLEYNLQRGRKRGVFHHDTAPFYDQIKARLRLHFNKNQLVDKLRRLKKKYRNIVSRIDSGRDFSFKSLHEQATFEISRKIWSAAPSSGHTVEDDEDGNIHLSTPINKVSRSRRRGRKLLGGPSCPRPLSPDVAMENLPPKFFHAAPTAVPVGTGKPSISNIIEDTVRVCLSPLFKELIYRAINGPCNSSSGSVAFNPLQMNYGRNASSETVDDRWRKQHILELEVYSKRLELVQEQIKSSLEDLRSMEKL